MKLTLGSDRSIPVEPLDHSMTLPYFNIYKLDLECYCYVEYKPKRALYNASIVFN